MDDKWEISSGEWDLSDEDVTSVFDPQEQPVKAKRGRKRKEEDIDSEEPKPVKAKRSRKPKQEDIDSEEPKPVKAKRGRKSRVSADDDVEPGKQKAVKAKRGRTPVGFDPEWLEGLTVKELNKLKSDIQRQMRARTLKRKKSLALKRSLKAKAKGSKAKSGTKRVTKPRVSVAKPAPIRQLSDRQTGRFLRAPIQPQQRGWFARWFLGSDPSLPAREVDDEVDEEVDQEVDDEFDEDFGEDVEMEDEEME